MENFIYNTAMLIISVIITFSDCLLCAKHRAQCFMYIISYLNFPGTLCYEKYYCPHLTNEETEAQKS